MTTRAATARKKTGRLTDKAPASSRKVVRIDRGASAAALGPGAHFAKLFKRLRDGQYEAHLMSGERLVCGVAPEVDLELADQCLAEQEIVLLGLSNGEPVVFGALRTKARTSEELVLEAPRRIVLKSGKSKLELSADGKVRLTGGDVTVDAPREVRLASARVEIP
ncbi:MAG: hypothetical protein U0271_22445 [Polyangiaceae bacterium]